MAVSAKMTVDVSGFKQGMAEAAATVRTLDAELKRNEAQFRATGNSEQYVADKATLLQMKMSTQKTAVTNLERALKQMKEAGVDPLNTEYQKLQTQLANAQTGLLNTSVEMNNLATSEENASRGAQELNQNVEKIGRKLSLDQVISGIGSITSAMEKAGRAAIDLGKKIWENITDSARWADDAATQAMMLNMDVEQYQRYKQALEIYGELTVAEFQKMKLNVQKLINNPTDDQIDIMKILGLNTHEQIGTAKYGGYIDGAAKDFETMFWEIGQRLKQKVESGQLTQDMADLYANSIFGKSFAELYPLLNLGQEGFTQALADQNVVTEESVNKLAELNDKLSDLQTDFNVLKNETMASLAPALTTATEALDGLLESLIDYLNKPEGQAMLQTLSESVSKMFEGLGDIDPEKVVSDFSSILGGVVDSFTWIAGHWTEVVDGIKAIGAAFLGLKIAEAGLTFIKFISGLKELLGGGGGNNDGTGDVITTGTGGTGPSWLNGIWTKLTTGAFTAARTLGTYDTFGSTALVWQTFLDQFAAGRAIRDGGDIGDALGAGWNELIASAKEGLGNFAKYFTQDLPNAFWGMFGLDKDKLSQAGENLKIMAEFTTDEHAEADLISDILNGEESLDVNVDPVTVDGANQLVSEQIGPVPVTVVPVVSGGGGFSSGGGNFLTELGLDSFGMFRPHANGIWSVPWDGYPAILHRGERVVPAREVRAGNNYSSNLYVESMYMQNGTDAEGLAAAMAAAQQRMRAGYGS